MTRISTYNSFKSGTQGILDGQAKMAIAQEQASSQKVSSDLKGYGTDAKRLINGKNLSEKLGARNREIEALEARAQVEAVAYSYFTESVDDLRSTINNALANQNGGEFRSALEGALQVAINSANTEFSGQAIFGGIRAYESPFVNASLDTLALQPNTDPNWVDMGQNRTITLDDGRVIELSATAEEVFRPIIDFIVDIRKWENANGAISGKLNNTQIAYLQTKSAEIANLQTAALDNEARAGITSRELSNMREVNDFKIAAMDKMVGDIENVDLSEVATRLAAAQTQYQASASIFGQLKDLNLLQFLR